MHLLSILKMRINSEQLFFRHCKRKIVREKAFRQQRSKLLPLVVFVKLQKQQTRFLYFLICRKLPKILSVTRIGHEPRRHRHTTDIVRSHEPLTRTMYPPVEPKKKKCELFLETEKKLPCTIFTAVSCKFFIAFSVLQRSVFSKSTRVSQFFFANEYFAQASKLAQLTHVSSICRGLENNSHSPKVFSQNSTEHL